MIVVFDAKCLVCSAWVRFLLNNDGKKVFRFASIQGDAGKALITGQNLDVKNLDTMLLVDGAAVYQKTEAIMRVLFELGGIWRIFSVARLIPSALRDGAYQFVARNRYRLLGEMKPVSCRVLTIATGFLTRHARAEGPVMKKVFRENGRWSRNLDIFRVFFPSSAGRRA